LKVSEQSLPWDHPTFPVSVNIKLCTNCQDEPPAAEMNLKLADWSYVIIIRFGGVYSYGSSFLTDMADLRYKISFSFINHFNILQK
jgi:hypothetical protein